ncbi:MAG: type IIA DNA topoisomerase subunit B, partial [Treponema sp.]|nr:type IIA DNA topoisomerase subunit B [Treponema sp.]
MGGNKNSKTASKTSKASSAKKVASAKVSAGKKSSVKKESSNKSAALKKKAESPSKEASSAKRGAASAAASAKVAPAKRGASSAKAMAAEKAAASKAVASAKTAESSKAVSSAKTAVAPALPAAKKSKVYDESQIKHLDALEHIRLRSGMYIGRLGDGSNQNDGIYVLLKEVIDNAVDEFLMGYGKRIDVEVKDNRVKVRDYGRGIPLGKVVECVSEINTGAKYNDDVFQFSVGMNGVGTKAVNALSSYFRVVSVRKGECTEAIFEQGKLKSQKTGKLKVKQPDGTYFEFEPDATVFGKYKFNMEFVEKRMWNYAYLNTGLTLRLNGQDFKSENGLFDLLNKEIEDTSLYPIGSYQGEHLKFAFTHTNAYGETYFSFVNGQYTADGGTHLNAFKEGLVKSLNEFYGTSYKAEDVREGLTAALLVKIKDPVFESQT